MALKVGGGGQLHAAPRNEQHQEQQRASLNDAVSMQTSSGDKLNQTISAAADRSAHVTGYTACRCLEGSSF
jgi:hypothetical protein